MAETRISLLDRALLDGVIGGTSVEQLASEHYITEVEVVKRVKAILASEDVFDEVEKRKITVRRLLKMAKDAEVNLDMSHPKSVEAMTKLLAMIDKLQTMAPSITDDDMERAAMAQAALLVRVVEAAWRRARALLVLEYPQVDLVAIDAAFNEGLTAAARELESAE